MERLALYLHHTNDVTLFIIYHFNLLLHQIVVIEPIIPLLVEECTWVVVVIVSHVHA